MLSVVRWEQKLKVIDDTKIKIDKDVIDLDAVPMAYILMKARYISLHMSFQEKVKDIQDADESRSLDSLNKPVREVAVYPNAFSGSANKTSSSLKRSFLTH